MEIAKIYELRFEKTRAYRQRIWKILCSDYFQQFVRETDIVCDLGCGEGQFINNIECGRKNGLDLNPNSRKHLAPGVTFYEQDSSTAWPFEDESLDLVFSSNFFEHLPSKTHLESTLQEAHRCLKPGGRVIAMGPNLNRIHGAYWDFWDHQIAITDLSMKEVLEISDFDVEKVIRSFIPYTLIGSRDYPMLFVRLYLRLPILWHFFGKQFLIVARK